MLATGLSSLGLGFRAGPLERHIQSRGENRKKKSWKLATSKTPKHARPTRDTMDGQQRASLDPLCPNEQRAFDKFCSALEKLTPWQQDFVTDYGGVNSVSFCLHELLRYYPVERVSTPLFCSDVVELERLDPKERKEQGKPHLSCHGHSKAVRAFRFLVAEQVRRLLRWRKRPHHTLMWSQARPVRP